MTNLKTSANIAKQILIPWSEQIGLFVKYSVLTAI